MVIGLSWIYYKSTLSINNKNQSLLCPLTYATKDKQAKIYNHLFKKAGFSQNKELIFVNIYDTSKATTANRKQLFSDEKVKNLLQEHFTQIDLYRFEKNNREEIKLFNPNISQAVNVDIIKLFGDHQFVFLSKDKTWLSWSKYHEYLEPKAFSELLELVIKEDNQSQSNKEENFLIPNLNYQQANHLDTKHTHENFDHNHLPDTNKREKVLVAQTPNNIKNKPYIQARLQAKAEQKLIFIHAFNLDCSHCQKMKEITLADKEVQDFLQDHFVKIDIDMQLKENFEVIRFYDIRTTPTFLFLNGAGQIVNISKGFQAPEQFITYLEKAMEAAAEGSYIDLMSRKRVNPTPDKLLKSDESKQPLPKGIQLLKAKVFPNPTTGLFTVAVNCLLYTSDAADE